MSQLQVTFDEVGTGSVVFVVDGLVEGPVRWLDSPQAVIDFVGGEDVTDTIVLSRGGTTTFLTPALAAGVKGIITLQGSPESHLGILSREYGIPCLMGVTFTKGVRSSRGEVILPDGALVRIDLTGYPRGWVSLDASVEAQEATAEEMAIDPEEAAKNEQLMQLMAAYKGEIPDGSAGSELLIKRMKTGVVSTPDASLRRDLSEQETGEFLSYCGWNLWDLIKARQTEGESGLIPRQEYETVGFIQQWATYGEYYRRIEAEIGIDGIIELGAKGTREIGTKCNFVHHWTALCPLIGRGLATTMGLEKPSDRPEDLQTIMQWLRRLQHGMWNNDGGPGFVSARDYLAPFLAAEWIERFQDEEHRLDDPDELATFRKFNATTEMAGFLLHYDNRAGLCDTGPYPIGDGNFIIVRDHFLHETAYEWSGVYEGLPYCVTEAMVFRPTDDQSIRINDIATTFAEPANYLKHLSGVAVYARDTWDTPMSGLRRVDLAEMQRITDKCNAGMNELYATIGSLDREQRIRNGVIVYTRDMMFPYARPAGLWDQFVQEGFDDFAPLTQQAWEPLITGQAEQVLGGVFLMGMGVVPESGLPAAAGPEALPALHALKLRGTLTVLPEGADGLQEDGLVASAGGGYLLTGSGTAAHTKLLAEERATLDLDAIGRAYERFLAANGPFKGLCSQWQAASEDQRFELLGQLEDLVGRVQPAIQRTADVAPRFAPYGERLTEALGKALDGDHDYVVSPRHESVHTVWMELHEDYLLTQDILREAEGSY
ncbi:MAG: PEP-utilizing enzyme [Solirubrobacteraceae bacterium]